MRPRNPIVAALAALMFGARSPGFPDGSRSTIPDTSRDGIRSRRKMPSYGQTKRAPSRTFFTFYSFNGEKRGITAPKGYAFNRRGDLVSLKRQALRQGVA